VDQVNRSPAEDPYELVSPLLKLAEDWLAQSEGANIPLELALHELRSRGDWRLSICRTPEHIEGVSVVMPRAHWYVEAVRPEVAELLSRMAVIHGRRPATLTTSQQIGNWLRPFLLETGGIDAERRVSLLRCTQPPDAHEGRWATADDVPNLRRYGEEIGRDRSRYMDTSWEVLVAITGLAVFSRDNSIVGSIRRYGPTPSYAAISDLFVRPEARRTGIATNLTGFVVGELLAKRKAVYVLVDEDDTSTLAFYRAIGFEDQGSFYRAHLE
jgi:ribosomal protein S18 acetylase RimI-like enzyme